MSNRQIKYDTLRQALEILAEHDMVAMPIEPTDEIISLMKGYSDKSEEFLRNAYSEVLLAIDSKYPV